MRWGSRVGPSKLPGWGSRPVSNVEVVQAVYRAFNDTDGEALLSLAADDLVVETGLLFDQGTFHGREGGEGLRRRSARGVGRSCALAP
jgi:ketosteroid isomerase-like protein